MPNRFSAKIYLTVLMPLCVMACGEADEALSETTVLAEPTTVVAECMAKFSTNQIWKGQAVRASFVYDASSLQGNKAETLFGADPATIGSYTVTDTDQDPELAKKEFLDQNTDSDFEKLEAGDLTLFRVNSKHADYDEVVREGCERLNKGVSIVQVTVSSKN